VGESRFLREAGVGDADRDRHLRRGASRIMPGSSTAISAASRTERSKSKSAFPKRTSPPTCRFGIIYRRCRCEAARAPASLTRPAMRDAGRAIMECRSLFRLMEGDRRPSCNARRRTPAPRPNCSRCRRNGVSLPSCISGRRRPGPSLPKPWKLPASVMPPPRRQALSQARSIKTLPLSYFDPFAPFRLSLADCKHIKVYRRRAHRAGAAVASLVRFRSLLA
jgi:hypothetical protein